MTIIIQPKRILIREFQDSSALSRFIKMNTITDLDMYFNISKEWISLFETTWKGEPVVAIPRRFPLDLLSNFVDIGGDNIARENNTIKGDTRLIKNPYDAKDEKQQEILNFLLGRGSFSGLAKKPRRALFTETGSGKTFSTLKSIAEENHFACIVCPDEKAILTWKQEIAKFTDIKPEEVMVLKGGDRLRTLIPKKNNYKIVLASSKTFSSLIIKGEFEYIEEFFNAMNFSLLVHDESHLNIIVLFFLEMMVATKRTYYLTATPGRRIFKEAKLLMNLMPDEASTFMPPPERRFDVRLCKYHSNPTHPDHVKGINKPRAMDYITYMKKIALNPNLPYMEAYLSNLRKVLNSARKNITKKGNKIAIVCKTKLENEILYNALSDWTKKHNMSMGIFNSDIEDVDVRFEETNRDLIITTDRSFAGIINIVDLEAIVILNPITSEEHLKQIAGRIRKQPGKKSLLYIMADGSFKRAATALTNAAAAMEDITLEATRITLNPKEVIKVDISEID